MDSRRSFLKKAALLGGAAATYQLMPESIARALAIEAEKGSTYLDAEHIVFLMQENRSFDHCFGALRGVRGFNDPRAIKHADDLPVWIQKNANNEAFGPFRLDIERTKATWMGSLPHSWKDMVAARNDGKLDTWLEAKKAGNKAYQHLPLTMGYHTREDIPFYYAFADAFTVCDQHFCSSLTGTSANRSYFWSGTIRENPHDPESTAHVDNGQINYRDVSWKTYPERLEEASISWKVYQNELSIPVGFEGEEEDWLANFTNNNLEFHEQYGVRYHTAHGKWMRERLKALQQEITSIKDVDSDAYHKLNEQIKKIEQDIEKFSTENFEKLAHFKKSIHKKAFTTNSDDPDYHTLTTLTYTENGESKTVQVPKGDIFYEFRKDVDGDNLPTVSWLTAPCRFSDHPSSPWFGAWYVSETLDILTKNPAVWKKTIFILTYDENDGYFDHIPPFVPAHPDRPFTGLNPEGMDTRNEYVTAEQERLRTKNPESNLDSPIGLGFRVPMVVASPWSKGGWVNSEVLDLTSNIQFLEHFIQKKTGKKVLETNLSSWRRAVCGDMTSVFRKAGDSEPAPAVEFVDRDAEVARIYTARTQNLPKEVDPLSDDMLQKLRNDEEITIIPKQEAGMKPACALPYDLNVNLHVDSSSQELVMDMNFHGKLSRIKTEMAVPLIVRAKGEFKFKNNAVGIWNFTVPEGKVMNYRWPLKDFINGLYDLEVHGPNGFYRRFSGNAYSLKINEPISVNLKEGKTILDIQLPEIAPDWKVSNLSYHDEVIIRKQKKGNCFEINCAATKGWYDILIESTNDSNIRYQYAGHLETGKASQTDPLMA